MKNEELKQLWLSEEQAAFSGWDFTRLENRWEEAPLSWDYAKIVQQYLSPEKQLLDLGTGGGEFLLTLGHLYHNTSITESWEPNYQLCKRKLEPLGITVRKPISDHNLPYADSSFDIVISRHEAYDLDEVRRVLRHGGMFITQQVGGSNNEVLSQFLIDDFVLQYSGFALESEKKSFLDHGFEILMTGEEYPSLRFFDVGAIVYFAKIIPWEFPGFSVEGCYLKLCELQRRMEKYGFIESQEHRFLLVSRKLID